MLPYFQTLRICFNRSGTDKGHEQHQEWIPATDFDGCCDTASWRGVPSHRASGLKCDHVMPRALYLSVKSGYPEISNGFSSCSSLKLPLRSVEGKLIPFRNPKSSKWNREQHKRWLLHSFMTVTTRAVQQKVQRPGSTDVTKDPQSVKPALLRWHIEHHGSMFSTHRVTSSIHMYLWSWWIKNKHNKHEQSK